MTTVPAQSFSAPARACVIAAARFMPGVCAVLVSSSFACTTRTPCTRHLETVVSVMVSTGASFLLSFDEPERLRRIEILRRALLHESRNHLQRDIGNLEAVVGHPFAQLRVLVDRVHHVRYLLSHRWRRRLGDADSAIRTVDPIESQFLERRNVRKLRQALLRRDGEHPHLS